MRMTFTGVSLTVALQSSHRRAPLLSGRRRHAPPSALSILGAVRFARGAGVRVEDASWPRRQLANESDGAPDRILYTISETECCTIVLREHSRERRRSRRRTQRDCRRDLAVAW